jgi:acyl-CoA synthetase (AMP-forming)/AMP-acid ligase II
MVSRHFDFLASLCESGGLPAPRALVEAALFHVEPLIGSAPVGPTTVKTCLQYAGKLPHVRFGSTETCLQVLGTPLWLGAEEKLERFQRGWGHEFNGEAHSGYYIGQHHPGLTEVKIVRSCRRGEGGYMEEVAEGENGYLVCRGDFVMQEYLNEPAKTQEAIHAGGWYTQFGDIGFFLHNPYSGGGKDVYWVSRDSTLLIRGGSNYAYEQLQAELTAFVGKEYGLGVEEFALAVVGTNTRSEHEDDCYLTVELTGERAQAKAQALLETCVARARAKGSGVSKAAVPDFVRCAALPKNFKGAILYDKLKEASLQHLKGEGGGDGTAASRSANAAPVPAAPAPVPALAPAAVNAAAAGGGGGSGGGDRLQLVAFAALAIGGVLAKRAL